MFAARIQSRFWPRLRRLAAHPLAYPLVLLALGGLPIWLTGRQSSLGGR